MYITIDSAITLLLNLKETSHLTPMDIYATILRTGINLNFHQFQHRITKYTTVHLYSEICCCYIKNFKRYLCTVTEMFHEKSKLLLR